MTLEERAKLFATIKHEGQGRKYSHLPYIVHPQAVAELVRKIPHTEEMIAAAWLHDTVEDTETSVEDIRKEFGGKVAELVEMLTDVSKPTDGNRKIRKEIDRQHTAKANPEAKTIKLADLIDNSKDIMANDPNFARVYIREKIKLLEVLQEGDPSLLTMANLICVSANQQFYGAT